LAEFDITTIHKMSCDQQRQGVKHFDIAREAYTLELQQRGHTQHLITKYMISSDKIVHDTLDSDLEDGMEGLQ
jgi:hypothetical protein